MPSKIPDRWLDYKPCGLVIEGTRIICFKVPLKSIVGRTSTAKWTVSSVLQEIPNLSAVIDLTNTNRYYDPKDLLSAGVKHKKILMEGRVVPPEDKVKEWVVRYRASQTYHWYVVKMTNALLYHCPTYVSNAALCRIFLPESNQQFIKIVGRTSTAKWTVSSVLQEIPNLSAVIDLTNTNRYYDPKDLLSAGVKHKKILMEGRVVPPEDKVKEFMRTMDEYLARDEYSLVGVHCTHGLNRTGYMVCRYMRDRLGIPAQEAIRRFEVARGYRIERQNLVGHILDYSSSSGPSKTNPPRESRRQRRRRTQFLAKNL